MDRTFGSPTIITVDGEFHRELRRALDSKYRPRQVSTYIDGLVRGLPPVFSMGWPAATGPS